MRDQRLWRLQTRCAPYLFVAPFVLIFGVFMGWPLAQSIVLSATDDGPGGITSRNLTMLMRDRVFWGAAANTTLYALALLLVQLPLALGLALILDSPRVRGKRLLRLAFFTPFLIGNVFAAVLFAVMLDTRHGLVNHILSMVAMRPVEIDWLGNPRLVMMSVLLCSLWLTTGFAMLCLLAALQSVNPDLHDAAKVDGAGRWTRFWHVTLPSIRPVLSFLVLAGLIQAYQLFELPYILFGGPGPGSRAITIVMYLYGTGFEAGDFHYASMIGWAMVILLATFTAALGAVYRWTDRPGRRALPVQKHPQTTNSET